MGTELGKAYVQIVPSAQGISGSISSVLDGEASSAGVSAGKSLSSKIIGVLKTAGIGLALKQTIMEGANLEQSIGGIETLFGDYAETMKKNAAEAYKTAGLSANAYMETVTSFSASLLQSTANDTKKAGKIADMALRDMSDNANKFGTDMQSIQNAYQGFAKQNYTMLDNLKLGYGGTKSEMERLLRKAEEISGVKYDINNLSDVYNAIHVIQEKLLVTGTTAKEASTTLSGSFASMKAAASNVLAELTLGNDGIQSVSQAMSALVDSAVTFVFGNLVPALGRIAIGLPQAIVSGIISAVPQVASAMGDIIKAMTQGLKEKVPELLKAAPEMFDRFLDNIENNDGKFFESAGRILKNFGSALIENLPALAEAAKAIIARFGEFIVDNAPEIALGAGKLLLELGIGILNGIPIVLESLGTILMAIIEEVAKWPQVAIEAGINFIMGLCSGLVPDSVLAKMQAVVHAMIHPVETAKATLKKLVDGIKKLFSGLHISFPHIKVPHFNISAGKAPWGIGGKGVAPKIDLNWYKTGGIFSEPSVIGVGEAGKEAVVPLDKFWNKLDNMNNTIDYDRLAGALAGAMSDIEVVVISKLDGKVVSKEIAPLIQKEQDVLNGRMNRKLGYI